MWKVKVRLKRGVKKWTERFFPQSENVFDVVNRLPSILRTKFNSEPCEILSFTVEGQEVREKAAIAAVKKRKRQRRK